MEVRKCAQECLRLFKCPTGERWSVCQSCHRRSIDHTWNKSGQDFHSIDRATGHAL